jgi:[ribosomal protein S5]-alanine N-acetyltransferase
VIRPLVPGDAEELAALLAANRSFLAPFEPVRPDSFFTVAGQRARLSDTGGGEYWRFAILDGEAIAGTISLANVTRGAFQSATTGYWVDRERNGRGLATAAVGELVRFAFEEAGLHRVEAGTLVDNVASQRVLERNGFERFGLAPRYLHIGGAWRDHVLFQRLAD